MLALREHEEMILNDEAMSATMYMSLDCVRSIQEAGVEGDYG